MTASEHGLSADLPRLPHVEHTVAAAELRAVGAVTRTSSVVVGRDALGNVFITGDGNTVEVKLTVVAADTRLRARDPSTLHNPYRGLDAFRETDSAVFFGREDLIRGCGPASWAAPRRGTAAAAAPRRVGLGEVVAGARRVAPRARAPADGRHA